MNLVEKVCKRLGVVIGEEWEGTDGAKYKILSDGSIIKNEVIDYTSWDNLMKGEVTPVWEPKEGEEYFVPHFSNEERLRYLNYEWSKTRFHIWNFENNIAFKTKEEAIKCTNEMLKTFNKNLNTEKGEIYNEN